MLARLNSLRVTESESRGLTMRDVSPGQPTRARCTSSPSIGSAAPCASQPRTSNSFLLYDHLFHPRVRVLIIRPAFLALFIECSERELEAA